MSNAIVVGEDHKINEKNFFSATKKKGQGRRKENVSRVAAI